MTANEAHIRDTLLADIRAWHKQEKRALCDFVRQLHAPNDVRDTLQHYILNRTLPPRFEHHRAFLSQLPAPHLRCVAALENGAQCHKTRADTNVFCAIHQKTRPFGVHPAGQHLAPNTRQTTMHVLSSAGISLIVDATNGNVYHTEDILARRKRPRVIGTYHHLGGQFVFPEQETQRADMSDTDNHNHENDVVARRRPAGQTRLASQPPTEEQPDGLDGRSAFD